VEDTSSPKRDAAIGRDDDRKSAPVRGGIGVDGGYERQTVSAVCARGSVEASSCMCSWAPLSSLNIDNHCSSQTLPRG